MISHVQTELGLEPWVGDSQDSVHLTTPAASPSLDKNTH